MKTDRLISFQKPSVQSVLIFFNFVHPHIRFYLWYYLILSSNFLSSYFVSPHLVENFHCLNFDRFRDTTPDLQARFRYHLNFLDTCYTNTTIFISPSDNQVLLTFIKGRKKRNRLCVDILG